MFISRKHEKGENPQQAETKALSPSLSALASLCVQELCLCFTMWFINPSLIRHTTEENKTRDQSVSLQ